MATKFTDKPVTENQWPDGFDLTSSNKNERDAYARYQAHQYSHLSHSFCGDDLWDQFREDFEGWTATNFKNANNQYTQEIRIELQQRGVWVNKAKNIKLPDALYATLYNEQNGVRQPVGGGGGEFAPPVPPQPPVDTAARDIINLSKMITTENKYSGQNDHFDTKLTIFNEYCSQLNISDDVVKAKAYSFILKDIALQHYLNNKTAAETRAVGTGIPYQVTFAQLCQATRDYFENDEYRRSQLQSFNSISKAGDQGEYRQTSEGVPLATSCKAI